MAFRDPQLQALVATLTASLEALLLDLPRDPPTRGRHEWRFGRKGSLKVNTTGPWRGYWTDFETGERGDPLKLIAYVLGCSTSEALRWAQEWLSVPAGMRLRPAPKPPVAPPAGRQEASRSRTADLGRRLWGEGVDPRDTLVEVYLSSRSLALPPEAPLRFHPSAWRNPQHGPCGPAMLAEMTDPRTGEWCGTHVTYLRGDGGGKAPGHPDKVMFGNAGVVRLVLDEEVTLGIGIAEGIETSLAVMQRARWAPVWAATSAGGIARFPVLPGIECMTVFADGDAAGLRAAQECARRWADAGREVHILAPPEGRDFDDVSREAA